MYGEIVLQVSFSDGCTSFAHGLHDINRLAQVARHRWYNRRFDNSTLRISLHLQLSLLRLPMLQVLL